MLLLLMLLSSSFRCPLFGDWSFLRLEMEWFVPYLDIVASIRLKVGNAHEYCASISDL